MYATEFIHKYTNMSARPEAYSGRGVTTTDLDDQKLQKFADGLRTEFGEDSVRDFVRFIADIDRLSATNFLNQFFLYYSPQGFKYTPRKIEVNRINDVVCQDEQGEFDVESTMLGMFAFMGNKRTPEQESEMTESIRTGFLRRYEEFLTDEQRERRSQMVSNMFDDRYRRGVSISPFMMEVMRDSSL